MKLGVIHTCNLSPGKIEARGSGIQGLRLLHLKLEASMGYQKTCLNKDKSEHTRFCIVAHAVISALGGGDSSGSRDDRQKNRLRTALTAFELQVNMA